MLKRIDDELGREKPEAHGVIRCDRSMARMHLYSDGLSADDNGAREALAQRRQVLADDDLLSMCDRIELLLSARV